MTQPASETSKYDTNSNSNLRRRMLTLRENMPFFAQGMRSVE
jgi:hypothetical protein